MTVLYVVFFNVYLFILNIVVFSLETYFSFFHLTHILCNLSTACTLHPLFCFQPESAKSKVPLQNVSVSRNHPAI